jgi:hypothetical protein
MASFAQHLLYRTGRPRLHPGRPVLSESDGEPVCVGPTPTLLPGLWGNYGGSISADGLLEKARVKIRISFWLKLARLFFSSLLRGPVFSSKQLFARRFSSF